MEKLPVEKLPVEVLEKVFEFLPWKDRKSVVLVNRLWRKAGEAPRLWAWVQLPTVKLEDQNSEERVIEMLSSKRLARVERIYIQPEAVSEDLLQAMIQHGGLRRIWLVGLGGEWQAGLNSQLVIEVLSITRVEDLDLDSLPAHLIISLLTEVSQGGSTLKRLHLFDNNLGEVPAALVASALTRLVEVRLTFSRLTTDQVAALMEEIDQGNSSIEKLVLHTSLPAEGERTGPLNLKPLVKLEEVHLWNNFHTQQELADFFAALSPSTKLRKLTFPRLPWPVEEMDGSTEVMARAINFLEDVIMEAYPDQVLNLQSSSPEV